MVLSQSYVAQYLALSKSSRHNCRLSDQMNVYGPASLHGNGVSRLLGQQPVWTDPIPKTSYHLGNREG